MVLVVVVVEGGRGTGLESSGIFGCFRLRERVFSTNLLLIGLFSFTCNGAELRRGPREYQVPFHSMRRKDPTKTHEITQVEATRPQ